MQLLFAYPKKKQYGMKDYKKDLGETLNRILKDWDHYVLIEEK